MTYRRFFLIALAITFITTFILGVNLVIFDVGISFTATPVKTTNGAFLLVFAAGTMVANLIMYIIIKPQR